jgi:D-arabinose 1-dehydrogenase-like Zn-dependent alcohol dehydrogenase
MSTQQVTSTGKSTGDLDALPETMKAARLDLVSGEFGIHQIPVPRPKPAEVLIRVRAAGVCLSDVHVIDRSLRDIRTRDDQTVITMGHEIAGTIAAIGPDVPPIWHVGDNVCLTAGDRDGRCFNCLYDAGWCLTPLVRGVNYDGGWADYTVTHYHSLAPIPNEIPFEQAAIIPDAVSTPWGALMRQGGLRAGESVGVWGAGGLGAHAVRIARLAGATPIVAVDTLPAARERALDFGADYAFDAADGDLPGKIRQATRGRGLDVAVDFVAIPAVRVAIDDALAPHGRLVLVGMSMHPLSLPQGARFIQRQHRAIGAYGGEPADLHTLANLVVSGRLDLSKSVTEVLPLTQAAEAVHRLAAKIGDPVRIVLVP